MTQDQHGARRTDARQNRARILEVAREALTASEDVSLNAIAKRAGVGPGTLYRHFPSREALVLAVYRYDVEQLVDAAPLLLEEHPPLDALRLWLERLAYTGKIKYGLADVLNKATGDPLLKPVTDAITLLLQACQRTGGLRPDVEPDDILLLVGFLWRMDPSTAWKARTDRLLNIVMSGLRAPSTRESTDEA